jgi:hypothetical protein
LRSSHPRVGALLRHRVAKLIDNICEAIGRKDVKYPELGACVVSQRMFCPAGDECRYARGKRRLNADAALSCEERLHTAPSPSNRYSGMRYIEVANEMELLYERLAGKPRVEVISLTAALKVA